MIFSLARVTSVKISLYVCSVTEWLTSLMERLVTLKMCLDRFPLQCVFIFCALHFLAVQNSSIGDLVTDSVSHSLTHGTFTFDIQRATQETCDIWDNWSVWWGDITWLKMTFLPAYLTTYLPTYLPPLQSDPRDLWPLRHLIRVMKRHDLTKTFYLPTYLPVHLP